MFQVSSEEGAKASEELHIPYIECSAKHRMNVDNAFYELVRLIRKFQASERTAITKPVHNNNKKKCNIL